MWAAPAVAQPLGPNETTLARCQCTCIYEGAPPVEGQLREIVHLRLPRGGAAACVEYEGTLCPGRIYAVTLPYSRLRGCRSQIDPRPGAPARLPGATTGTRAP